MPFDDARVLWQREAGDDGVAVVVDACGEGMKAGQVVPANGVEPLRESFALAFGEHLSEESDVSGEGVELEAVGQDSCEELFGLGERFRTAEDPLGHRARLWRLCGDRTG
ncbi:MULTISPECIES: hypothetical protein [unclassified Streptomyces]|uniref:hypothetical protein n=1 Tax=unclassified Streptomyces TaxID=2593676 RepID=UPI002DDA16DA|nr:MULTISPECIES: hypothetical protein [unclassified Streptomyces]WSC42536.1 hypothetical protein OHA08_41560 [Streptomyces sp. NBC_01763]WSC59192.1 hypothetical protein OG808_03380 [Streptomyces sp. NBC_01761]WSF90326.1 hypothetical protein OIE70_03520 [Streptomyces sp. NBC_01744]